jgi:endogenous inhibitor of DNA gyrase (YacG/DUF329 family)
MSSITCSICGKSFDPDSVSTPPFCSKRCYLIDRGRWLNEEYGMPYEPEDRPEGHMGDEGY